MGCRFLQAGRLLPGHSCPMFVGVADTCPGSQDLQGCKHGKPCWSMFSTDVPRPSTPPTRDLSLAGGNPLFLPQGDSHGPFPHQIHDAFASRRPRAPQRAVVQVPRVRRSAAIFDIGLRRRPPALRREGSRHHRRCHRRQAQAERVRCARFQAGDHRPRRRRQGACPTLRTAPFRWAAGGHAGRAHRDDVRRHSLHRQDAHPRLRAGQAAHSRAAVHGAGSAHPAVGGNAGADGFRRITHMLVDAGAGISPGSIRRRPRSSRRLRRSASRSRPRSSRAG